MTYIAQDMEEVQKVVDTIGMDNISSCMTERKAEKDCEYIILKTELK